MARKFARDAEELSSVAVLLDDLGEFVAPKERVRAVANQAGNRILVCAYAGDAEPVVTRDKAMLALGNWRIDRARAGV